MANTYSTINFATASVSGTTLTVVVPAQGLRGSNGDTSQTAYELSSLITPVLTDKTVTASNASSINWTNNWSAWNQNATLTLDVSSIANGSSAQTVVRGGSIDGTTGYTYFLTVARDASGNYTLSGWENGCSATDIATTTYTMVVPSDIHPYCADITLQASGRGPAVVTTVTLSDGGAGGTFTPATVVFAVDDTSVHSVAYTNSTSVGSITISATNDQSLTNPAPVTATHNKLSVSLVVLGATYSLDGGWVNFTVPVNALQGGDGNTSAYQYCVGVQDTTSNLTNSGQLTGADDGEFTWGSWGNAGSSYNPAQENYSSPYYYCIKGRDASGNIGYSKVLTLTENADKTTWTATGWENGSAVTTAPSTTYTLTGNTIVDVNTPVVYTVTPNNAGPSKDTVITFSDGGAGGVFTPATVTLSAGSTTAQTTSYTNATAGNVTISTTNNQSLTNPTAISLSVINTTPTTTPSTTYSLSGATTGYVSSALTLKLVANNQGPVSDTTITFSDGGAGGTFSPTTATLKAGSTKEVDVTYTPAAAGTVTITTTNNTSLTDPAALTITVEAATPTTAYTLKAPATAYVTQAVEIDLTPNGTGTTADVTVTLSDNGAGGAFSSTTVTFKAGDASTQKVTYTPASATTISISATNSGGLTNPAAVSMTTTVAVPLACTGNTTATFNDTNGTISVSAAFTGGINPTYTILRAPASADWWQFVSVGTTNTLPYIDTGFPCGVFNYQIKATDQTISTPLQPGTSENIEAATRYDISTIAIDSASHAFMNKTDGLIRMDIYGNVPIDQSIGKSNCVVKFTQNGQTVCTYGIALKVSGQSTANDPKKGYAGKLSNSKGKTADIKFGDWEPQSKLSLKAYFTDDSRSRDIVANRFFKQISQVGEYPYNLGYPLEACETEGGTYVLPEAAPMGTDGFPVKLFINGIYQGLYINRTSGDNQDWLIDDSNPNHYLLQADHAGAAMWGTIPWSSGFNPAFWDVTSPSMQGYVNQSDFSSTFPTQYAKCSEPFDWIKGVIGGTVDFDSTVDAMWDLQSVYTYIIASEVSDNSDGIANNVYLLNWGTKWYIKWYDLDETFGRGYMTNRDPVSIGMITQTNSVGSSSDTQVTAIWNIFWNRRKDEIKAFYKQARDSGVISVDNIAQLFTDFRKEFGNTELINDWTLWTWQDVGSTTAITEWVRKRIAYLDSQLGYVSNEVTFY